MTPEAKAVFNKYREWFSKIFKHQWTEEDYVFLSTKRNIGEPITRSVMAVRMKRLSERSGVQWSIHDGRRIVQKALESAGTSSNWIKKVKGRKVSSEESPYSKPNIEQLRQKYREALPELEFLNESNVNVKKLNELEHKLGEKDQVIESLVRNGENSKDENAKLQQRVREIEQFLSTLEKSMRTGRKFEEADKETQQRGAAMTEYFEKYPELQISEEKVPNEILGKAQNGFEEYYHKKKLKAKPTP